MDERAYIKLKTRTFGETQKRDIIFNPYVQNKGKPAERCLFSFRFDKFTKQDDYSFGEVTRIAGLIEQTFAASGIELKGSKYGTPPNEAYVEWELPRNQYDCACALLAADMPIPGSSRWKDVVGDRLELPQPEAKANLPAGVDARWFGF